MIDVVAFDADDTLWHTESLYVMTQEHFKDILASYDISGDIDDRLYETEMRNLNIFGYGAKGFMLSMIETAVDLTDGSVRGDDIQRIIDTVRAMMSKEIRLLDQVAETIPSLAEERTLMIITKGDLLEQESKIARSNLADHFEMIEIVSRKDTGIYRQLLEKHGIDPRGFLMVGNSLPSDILPVLELGGRAVHIPHHVTWAHETAELQSRPKGFYEAAHMGQLPRLLNQIDARLE